MGALPLHAQLGALGKVCRLGLASRGNTNLDAEDVLEGVRRGVNYLNWCGYPDGISEAVRRLGENRGDVVIATQLSARSAVAAHKELDEKLAQLGTDTIDVVTHYYLEHESEWEEVQAPGGAHEALVEARARGVIGAIGLTSHQRRLAARIAASGRIDLLMIRYNAAHRGAEEEVFPLISHSGMPIVAFTGMRWGALIGTTVDDPPGFVPPGPLDCYRFVLSHPSVTVGLMAPDGRRELEEDLRLLDDWRALTGAEDESLRAHGDRVRRHAGSFP